MGSWGGHELQVAAKGSSNQNGTQHCAAKGVGGSGQEIEVEGPSTG